MSSEHSFEDKGKVKPKPSQEVEQPTMDDRPITVAEMKGNLNADKITRMQKTLGNSAVQRFLAQRSGQGKTDLDDETAKTINTERGSGQALDQGIAQKAGAVMDQDFSNVNVHTGDKADSLSQQLQAKAFTVGNDIFFREGEYNPGSGEGQELISHELTHVVQQGASPPNVQGKMTVNDPNDQFESEADKVANTVMNAPDDAQRQDEEEVAMKPDLGVQRQDEEEVAMKPDLGVQRQDEEEVAMKPDLDAQRQDEDEVAMKPDLDIQRQDEDEVAMKPDLDIQRQEEEEQMR
jgi:hypothetical protein